MKRLLCIVIILLIVTTVCLAEKYELYIDGKYVCNETEFGEIIKGINVWWAYSGDNWTELNLAFEKEWNNTGVIRITSYEDRTAFRWEVLYKEWKIDSEILYIEAITEDKNIIIFKQVE